MRDFAASGVGVMICGFLIDLENPARLRRSARPFKEEVIPAWRREAMPGGRMSDPHPRSSLCSSG
jgi:hypothetical protein